MMCYTSVQVQGGSGVIDRYALELERAIFNYRLGGNNASYVPVANALMNGMANGMEVLVPVQQTDTGLRLFDPNDDHPTRQTDEDESPIYVHSIGIEGSRNIVMAFTSEEELELGEHMDVIRCRMSDLIQNMKGWTGCTGIAVNPYNLTFNIYSELLDLMTEKPARSAFEIVRGSVLNMHVGAIVNAANSSLLGGGGVDGAIHRLAGPGLKEECRSIGGCRTGEAVITGSYDIDYVDAIIHTVGPVYSGKAEDRISLANCYLSSLEAASANGITSIAFPCISTGAYGFPIAEAAKVSIMALAEWFESHRDTVMNVYLCCYRDEEFQSYIKVLGR